MNEFYFTEYKSNKDKYGGVLGRYANSIAGGRFTLDGVKYQLEKNLGPNHLHGGPAGFHKVFKCLNSLRLQA